VPVDRRLAREKAAAVAPLDPVRNVLIGNQLPGFSAARQTLCHRRNSRRLFAQLRALPAVFGLTAIVRRTT